MKKKSISVVQARPNNHKADAFLAVSVGLVDTPHLSRLKIILQVRHDETLGDHNHPLTCIISHISLIISSISSWLLRGGTLVVDLDENTNYIRKQ